jgi:hypothetical protein
VVTVNIGHTITMVVLERLDVLLLFLFKLGL